MKKLVAVVFVMTLLASTGTAQAGLGLILSSGPT